MLIYIIGYSIFDFQLFKPAIFFLLNASFLSSLVIFINNRGNHLAAKLLLSVLVPVNMIYIATIAFGNAPGFQVYLFVAAFIPLFLWSAKESWYTIVLVLLIVTSYFLIEFSIIEITPQIVLTKKLTMFFRQTNIATCFLVAGIAIASFQYLYSKMEEKIIRKTRELKISQAHKDQVYSIIAHDLRGPFGTINKLTKIYIEEYFDYTDEARLNFLKTLHTSNESMKQLLENLLEWSKMQSGVIEMNPAELMLYNLAEESLTLHNEQIKEKELKIELDINENLTVTADRYMISTVFRNLLSNAIKYSEQKGKISISASENNEEIIISFKDNGLGISGSNLKYLFDIRYINKVSENSLKKGSGLGLLLCKDFIDSHNGKIWVQSELSRGTEFFISLPKEKDSTN